ncbi:MAG: hypothetical protein AUJ48_04275 [Deltaproteobacteria bacterium CG1_02_45_11]|nr:MAG: hypothetical protein AUJ48_04275 [Deltaproteobacteria bacterium CG1_02_45_11]
MKVGLDKRIDILANWLYASRYPVVFTGAGISTESGLPDFRGPDGIWTLRDKGLAPEPMHKPWDSVDPNSGHLAIVEMQKIGKLKYLISQNVDNLHLNRNSERIPRSLLRGRFNKMKIRRLHFWNVSERKAI